MKWIHFCQNFYSATYIPISYFRWPQEFVWANPDSLRKMSNYSSALSTKIKFNRNPDYFITDSYAYFGMINIDESPSKMDFLIIGPLFSTPCSEETIHDFLHEGKLSGESADEMRQFLLNTPPVSFHQFLSILSFLNYSVNGKEIDTDEYFNLDTDQKIQDKISRQYSNEMYENRENEQFHDTYEFEQIITDCIERGDTAKIQSLLAVKKNVSDFSSGVLSANHLRNKRNLFISMTTLATRASIHGGLDVEQAYQLSDLYIQECEKTMFPDKIDQLCYAMLIDFSNRVARQQLPIDGMSKDVFQCVQYISKHTNEPLRVNDVADHIGKSRSYIIRKFQSELGFGISAFIMRCKLEEAKNLLTFTDKSLSEISNYLCFSSQAYFQNVFKKSYGVTPLQYRKKNQGGRS